MTRHRLNCAVLAALILALPAASRAAAPWWPAGVDLGRGVDLDEDYRAQFGLCDTADSFRGAAFPDRRSCRSDPNRVTALRRLPGGAVAYVSKLAVDFDGSPLACSADRNASDQCGTSLEPPDATGTPQPVNADRVPYVVIPRAGPAPDRGEFTRLTGVEPGDFGVVIWKGRTVPVIVADTGPYNKLGEGSLALHRALGHEQCAERDAADTCRAAMDPQSSIDGDVVTVLFPGSARPGLTAETVEAAARTEGARLWAAYLAHNPPPRAPGAASSAAR